MLLLCCIFFIITTTNYLYYSLKKLEKAVQGKAAIASSAFVAETLASSNSIQRDRFDWRKSISPSFDIFVTYSTLFESLMP